MESNQDRRRGHVHRARRGHDRRGGPDRRPLPQAQAQAPAPGRDQVNVEQIMRDIRTRVAARSGVELSYEQIQDLAARRLESILDPRSLKPSLMEGLRRSVGAAPPSPGPKMSSEPVYTFEDTTIYDSHRAILRWIRKLLNPLLKLLFNPNPLIRAMHLQAHLNTEAAARDAERDRTQAEWNALHYEILQRLVTEVSRVSLESQAMSNRVESLDARIEFANRRVRTLEGTQPQARTGAREAPPAAGATPAEGAPADSAVDGGSLDGARRRRRRRRGRRSGAPVAEGGVGIREGAGPEGETAPDTFEQDDANGGDAGTQPESESESASPAPLPAALERAEQAGPSAAEPVVQQPTPTADTRRVEEDQDTNRFGQ